MQLVKVSAAEEVLLYVVDLILGHILVESSITSIWLDGDGQTRYKQEL